MNILIVGSGGREHAIGWKINQSPKVTQLYFAPGNAGTMLIGTNVSIQPEDIPSIVQFTKEQPIDLVIVGPESSLAAGLIDALQQAGIRAFGPTQAAAQIESSKSFSKAFMERHGIPTARFARFTKLADATTYLSEQRLPIVIKASGLAAGKGVFIVRSFEEGIKALESIMVEKAFGDSGDEVIIEEYIEGEEISLLTFTDGNVIRSMLPTQDHKRLLDHDQGPNTGGMGAYTPSPVCSKEMVQLVEQIILQPAVDGLRSEVSPFTGVLYAGLILTDKGPMVLEFNCRFGDPETQVILPLLENDLLDVIDACIDQTLAHVELKWKTASAVTVVLASGGYPGKYQNGLEITGLNRVGTNTIVFHAGTKLTSGKVVTSGGRVLNVTSVGNSLEDALNGAYASITNISFPGMIYRKDIAHRALKYSTSGNRTSPAYAQSGVNIDAGNRAVDLMRESVKSTYTPAVLAGIGSFGGLFDAGALAGMNQPVLVGSTDGVGTKVRLAALSGCYEGIGQDIVNHCINDILVQGAQPLFFLDYFACSKLEPEIVARIISGISLACRDAGCVLLGGETAEMPGVYAPGEFDLAGTIVGVVEKEKILPKNNLTAGDLLVGISSSGPHTNGYSLIRKIFDTTDLHKVYLNKETSLQDALLKPHRSYLRILEKALNQAPSPIKALAHLTGGGYLENIPRILPEKLSAEIKIGSWPIPPLFSLIQEKGNISTDEMYRVFNMGIGMIVVVEPAFLSDLQKSITEETWVIGHLTQGVKGVVLNG
jgi:phosphoribosylamine--glycine ligase/phosphoribosylaminoimidazole synthetase